MTGDKITYGESVECPGRWKRLDYETTVQESETVETASIRARYFVQTFFYNEIQHSEQTKTSPAQEVKITPEEEEQSLLEEIANATAETIEQWKIPALRNVKTKGAYSLRLKQLNLQ